MDYEYWDEQFNYVQWKYCVWSRRLASLGLGLGLCHCASVRHKIEKGLRMVHRGPYFKQSSRGDPFSYRVPYLTVFRPRWVSKPVRLWFVSSAGELWATRTATLQSSTSNADPSLTRKTMSSWAGTWTPSTAHTTGSSISWQDAQWAMRREWQWEKSPGSSF